jgi:TRAP-type C4-dicarboxylate transport system permease small subunit
MSVQTPASETLPPRSGRAPVLVRIEEGIAQVLLAVTSGLVFVGALARTLGHPLIWAIDIAQMLFIWCCFLGADVVMRRNGHIAIDIVTRYLPSRIQELLETVWLVVIAIFLGIIIYYGTRLTLLNLERPLGDTPLSYALVTGAVPVGCALLLISTLVRLRQRLTGRAAATSGGSPL